MKIKEIKNKAIRDRAVELSDYQPKFRALNKKLRQAFVWDWTTEGNQFWYDVNEGLEPDFPRTTPENN